MVAQKLDDLQRMCETQNELLLQRDRSVHNCSRNAAIINDSRLPHSYRGLSNRSMSSRVPSTSLLTF